MFFWDMTAAWMSSTVSNCSSCLVWFHSSTEKYKFGCTRVGDTILYFLSSLPPLSVCQEQQWMEERAGPHVEAHTLRFLSKPWDAGSSRGPTASHPAFVLSISSLLHHQLTHLVSITIRSEAEDPRGRSGMSAWCVPGFSPPESPL